MKWATKQYTALLKNHHFLTTHVSPFMTREKPDSVDRRVIIDLSWPDGHAVNSFINPNVYLGTAFKLRYPTVDNITEYLASLGKGARLFKIDLARAFRQLRVDPHDFNLLCLKWENDYFVDGYTPFGLTLGSMFCSRLSQFFRHLMWQRKYTIFCYIDDCVGCMPQGSVDEAFQYLLTLLSELNFPISTSKLVSPTTECTCLGVVINTVKQTISITAEKQKEIMITQTTVTKRSMQSLVGSLMFIHKCVKSSRYFTNRLLEVLRQSTNKFITVSEGVSTGSLNFFPNSMDSANMLKQPHVMHTQLL